MISIPLYLTDKHPCSYLDDQLAQPAFVHPLFEMTSAIYSELIKQGYRRSGDEVYSPHCPNCSACIPVRIPVAEFKPTRSQRRCWRKNENTQVIVKPPEYNRVHYDLYLRYQHARHKEGSMAKSAKSDYMQFLRSDWCETHFIEFFVDNTLAAIAVVDKLDKALSAVYTFYDPHLSSYSLGTYAVLWQIEWAKKLEKEFLYLGFWIKRCKKMSYKSDYRPLQVMRDKQWVLLDEDCSA